MTKIKNITKDIISSYGETPKSNFLRDNSTNNVADGLDSVKMESSRDSEYLELAKDPKKNEKQLREMVKEAAGMMVDTTT